MKKFNALHGCYYNEARLLINKDEVDWYALEQSLMAGAFLGEPYCASMLYDLFFDFDSWSLEMICNIICFLEDGMKLNFWVSFYQAAVLSERIRCSRYSDVIEWAPNSLALLDSAVKYFKRVPLIVSDVSRHQIHMRRIDILNSNKF